jgi:hypothetical protein
MKKSYNVIERRCLIKCLYVYLFTLMIKKISVALVGGSSDNEGNVFATNPTTGFYGPVCDDGWAIEEVRMVLKQ